MATTAPINPVEVMMTGTWIDILSGNSTMDGKAILVSCVAGDIRVEKLSNAIPNTIGVPLDKKNGFPLFTKTAGYGVWVIGSPSSCVRVEVVE